MGPGSVFGSHVSVALRDGGGDGQVTVFAVHVVSGGSGVVTQPDADVFNRGGIHLIHLSRKNIVILVPRILTGAGETSAAARTTSPAMKACFIYYGMFG